jgi:hypothetical protein
MEHHTQVAPLRLLDWLEEKCNEHLENVYETKLDH